MNTIMLKINRRLAPRNVLPRAARSENDFWEQQAILPENEKTIEQGGRDGVLGSCPLVSQILPGFRPGSTSA